MNRKKKLFLFGYALIILIAVTSIVYYISSKNYKTDLYKLTPQSSAGNPSSEYLNAQRAVEYYRDKIEKNPDEVKNYIELAELFLQESRITGLHHEYIPRVKRLLDEALSRDPGNCDAMIMKASLLMTMHQFSPAKELIEKEIKINNHIPSAYGVLCDALVELGEYENAVKTCDRMLEIRPDLRSYARASYLRELYGDINGAVDAMLKAADAGVTGQENRAWVLYNLGNLFLNSGKTDTAEYIFKGILDERPNYAYALSGLADVYCVQHNYFKAIENLVKALQFTPEHIFVEKLADIYKVIGQKESENEMVNRVLDAFEQHEKDGYDIDLEYARFCLDHDMNTHETLMRAEKEFNRRPGNIDALDVYAWALYKNGKTKEAALYIQKALRLNTKRTSLFYHAGIIFKSVNDNNKAVKFLENAIAMNSYINPLYLDSAKRALNELSGIASIK
jgi:tetratricopeptide (TPR) repeat protein